MLRSFKELRSYDLQATDGKVGSVKDAYFDDREWIIRYFVVDTGGWILGRKVLLAPEVFEKPDVQEQEFRAHLSKQAIKDSPEIGEDVPVSRQHEEVLRAHYSWPRYWDYYPAAPAAAPFVPPFQTPEPASAQPSEAEQRAVEKGDPHLRSAKEVEGYRIAAKDGEVGEVDDFIIDDDDWHVRYLVVDTGHWLPGRKVLVSPSWVESVDWAGHQVHVDTNRETIKNAPAYDEAKDISREDEVFLHDAHKRPVYWAQSKH